MARYINGGALPPDLSVHTTAKHQSLDCRSFAYIHV